MTEVMHLSYKGASTLMSTGEFLLELGPAGLRGGGGWKWKTPGGGKSVPRGGGREGGREEERDEGQREGGREGGDPKSQGPFHRAGL